MIAALKKLENSWKPTDKNDPPPLDWLSQSVAIADNGPVQRNERRGARDGRRGPAGVVPRKKSAAQPLAWPVWVARCNEEENRIRSLPACMQAGQWMRAGVQTPA